jgi:predicted DNA-binding transcriptional regulator AlpA
MSIEEIISQRVTEAVTTLLNEKFDKISRPQRMMTLSQIADHCGVSKQSIINWTKRGENPMPVHYFGSDPRFYLDEVDEWSRK